MTEIEMLTSYNDLFHDIKITRNDNLKDKVELLNSNNISYDEKTKILKFINVEFQNILFKGSLLELSNDVNIQANKYIVFKNCKFEKIEFNNFDVPIGNFPASEVDFKDDIRGIEFNWDKETNQSMELIIEDSKFYGKFYINKQDDNKTIPMKIYKLEINKANFEQNFKLHHCIVDEIIIKDVDFQKNADFYKSKFAKGMRTNDIYFKSINFKSLALFGDTEFFKKLIFKYVTFEGHNHFKSAKLHKGLDLEYTNIQKEMNFYGIEIKDTSTTSQETYRIIKHQFEKLGNRIESNKYHSLELKKRRNNLRFYSLDYIVLLFHWISSNHSKNWLFALFWIFVVGIATTGSLAVDGFGYCSNNFIDVLKHMSILNIDECLKNNTVIFLLNKVSLGYLYYQFLTAVRKDTRK